jgi:hypothetical protein
MMKIPKIGNQYMLPKQKYLKRKNIKIRTDQIYSDKTLTSHKMQKEFFAFLHPTRRCFRPSYRTNYLEFFAEMFCNHHVFDNLTDKQNAWISRWIEISRQRNFVNHVVVSAAASTSASSSGEREAALGAIVIA